MMRMLASVALLAAAFALALSGAQGGEAKKKLDLEALFKKLDLNTDGKLSKDEFLKTADLAKDKADTTEKLKKVYDKLDPKGAGITLDLFKKFLEARKKAEK